MGSLTVVVNCACAVQHVEHHNNKPAVTKPIVRIITAQPNN